MNNRVCRNGSPLDRRHGNIALAARCAGLRPDAIRLHRRLARPRYLAPQDPLLKSYEGVLPGFTVRQPLPEHQKPWLSWLCSSGARFLRRLHLDIHRPASGVGKTVTNAPPVYSADRDPIDGLSGGTNSSAGWASRKSARWFAHLPSISPPSALYRAGALQHALRSGWTDRDFARKGRLARGGRPRIPISTMLIRKQKKSNFLPGMKGKVRDFRRGRVPHDPRSTGA